MWCELCQENNDVTTKGHAMWARVLGVGAVAITLAGCGTDVDPVERTNRATSENAHVVSACRVAQRLTSNNIESARSKLMSGRNDVALVTLDGTANAMANCTKLPKDEYYVAVIESNEVVLSLRDAQHAITAGSATDANESMDQALRSLSVADTGLTTIRLE
jgi:cysteine sulfinate desulfinase/cysteine desulfurase-like protein